MSGGEDVGRRDVGRGKMVRRYPVSTSTEKVPI